MLVEKDQEGKPQSQPEHGEVHNPADCEIQLIQFTQDDQTIKSFTDNEKLFLCKFLDARTRLKSGIIEMDDYRSEAKSLAEENEEVFNNESLTKVLADIREKTEVVKGYRVRGG